MPEGRSLRKKPRILYNEGLDSEEVLEPSETEDRQKPKPRKTPSQKPRQNTKKKAGRLAKLPEMPLDVLYEVRMLTYALFQFAHCSYVDL
jgi:hypothetical protein